ncbi:AraC family transcriptional regulator [Streptomyces sp. NBC_01304]|uniref:AraC family transcriptional regulator n=1 Tax=Streptomyces sp. NBC_01304 TaxID=2903818 RepID=UPI002E0DF711|nr:AraC family transcriptional regulator [Streptomyces sp. NBC_01304]
MAPDQAVPGIQGPEGGTRGILDAAELLSRVHFRRHLPAKALRPYVEFYWLIDWDLPQPYVSHVVPHPAVNVVFQRLHGQAEFGEVAGTGLDLFAQRLEGVGRVCGVKFRPGGFRPFAPGRAVADWTGRRLVVAEVFPAAVVAGAPARILGPDDEHARVAAIDAFLSSIGPRPDPGADLAMAVVERIQADHTLLRVAEVARGEGLSVRSLQRLFHLYVGVGPKWVILRYRLHEALERAESTDAVNWAALAADLGYADQAHLVRDFTATVGVPPTAYALRS